MNKYIQKICETFSLTAKERKASTEGCQTQIADMRFHTKQNLFSLLCNMYIINGRITQSKLRNYDDITYIVYTHTNEYIKIWL